MALTLDGKLVVAISSRALFDFEEENLVFEQANDRAYMALQLQRLDIPAKPGVAFSLVKKLLAFNAVTSAVGSACTDHVTSVGSTCTDYVTSVGSTSRTM